MQAELPSALLDLKFIQEKLATCGPTNTLGDIVKFWNILIKEKHVRVAVNEQLDFIIFETEWNISA